MEKNVKGIVLKQVEYKDNDAIINFLSEKGEYFAFYAYGIKKVTSKNAYALQPLTQSEITYFDKKSGLKRLKTADALENFSNNYKSYDTMITGFIIIDIINDIYSFDDVVDKSLYQILETCLKSLDDRNRDYILAFFLIHIMKRMGIELVVDGCARCGNQKINGISIKDGGFVCHECNQTQNFNITTEVLKGFRFINKCDFEHLLKFESDEDTRLELLKIIIRFFIEYTGIRNKTLTHKLKGM